MNLQATIALQLKLVKTVFEVKCLLLGNNYKICVILKRVMKHRSPALPFFANHGGIIDFSICTFWPRLEQGKPLVVC